MPASPSELSSIDFANMIGGPLLAVVKAQAQSAMTTVEFIKQVGFQPAPPEQDPNSTYTKNPIYVTFRYPKMIAPYQPAIPEDPDNGTPYRPPLPALFQDMELQVPFLTMVPIPNLRVSKFTLNFNAKINSITETSTSENVDVKAETTARASFLFVSVEVKVNAAYQKTTTTGEKVERTYSLDIGLEAVQDEMPAGLDRILGVLEDSIVSQPVAGPLDTNVPTPPAARPEVISIVKGDGQIGRLGEGLPEELVVSVQDNYGVGQDKKKVTWKVTNEDAAEATVQPTSPETNGRGMATAKLKLGKTSQTYQVSAELTDSKGNVQTVYFHARPMSAVQASEKGTSS